MHSYLLKRTRSPTRCASKNKQIRAALVICVRPMWPLSARENDQHSVLPQQMIKVTAYVYATSLFISISLLKVAGNFFFLEINAVFLNYIVRELNSSAH
jgi:hypothetical protein